MKRLCIVILLCAVAQSLFAQTYMIISKNGGSTDSLALSQIKNISFKTYGTPASGLVGAYLFAGNTNDASGTGNNGTGGNLTPVADRFGVAGCAYSFNGTTSSVGIPHSTSLVFATSQQFTVSLWVKFPTMKHMALAFKGNTSTYPYSNEWAIVVEPDSTLRLKVNVDAGNSNYSYLTSSASLHTNAWMHLVAAWNGTTPIQKLYLNGVLIGSTTAVTSVVTLNTQPLWLGYVADGPFQGTMDDVRIYSRELTLPEIQTLYHEGGW